MGKLFIVATPIGNLGDITFRAVSTLKKVDVILCEDTRVTKKLLERYNIKKPTLSYNSHSKLSKVDKILDLLQDDKDLALVSDAGTPGISDPGSQLVKKVKEVLPNTVVIAVPGPNAAIAALSGSGLPASDFLFLGFLPHKKGREKLFKEIEESKRTVVFYESPHRVLKTLTTLSELLESKRTTVVAKELTKIHEEFVHGSPREALDYFSSRKDKVKGEFVIIVSRR